MPKHNAAGSVREPSATTEHYLRAILELKEERGYARVVDIATRVGVTKGTVSIALGQLAERGFVKFDSAHFPVLTTTGRRIAARLGLSVPPDQAGFLAESLPNWRPFPDTNRGLRQLADAGYRLGILSNVDDDLLAWTRRHFPAPFEIIVTAEQVGSYKPAPAHFAEARARIGDRAWLHAAQSYFHDIAPAVALGIPVAWVNRKSERAPEGSRPAREVHDVLELARWLAQRVASAA